MDRDHYPQGSALERKKAPFSVRILQPQDVLVLGPSDAESTDKCTASAPVLPRSLARRKKIVFLPSPPEHSETVKYINVANAAEIVPSPQRNSALKSISTTPSPFQQAPALSFSDASREYCLQSLTPQSRLPLFYRASISQKCCHLRLKLPRKSCSEAVTPLLLSPAIRTVKSFAECVTAVQRTPQKDLPRTSRSP